VQRLITPLWAEGSDDLYGRYKHEINQTTPSDACIDKSAVERQAFAFDEQFHLGL